MNIARVFFEVDMRCNFNGLLKICHKAGIKPSEKGQSFIVFINSSHSKFKLLINNTYLVYHDNGKRKFPLDAIKFLPGCFSGNEFRFDRALEKSLLEKMDKTDFTA